MGFRILCAFVVLGFGMSLAGAAQQCPAVIWADEFEGSALDLAKWSYQIGDGCSEGICGWGNNELQSYQEANIAVSGGTLKITAREQRIKNKNYTSGRIRTLGKGDWNFGRFEARMKIPTGQGLWPAFWMLSTDEVFGPWPASGEVDIMENIGSEPDTVHGTMHYGADFQNRKQASTTFRLLNGELFPEGFHEFAVEQEAGVIRWFVDGVLFFTQTQAGIAPENWPYDERFHILLNLAVGGNFPGNPDATTVFPQTLEVEYVRVYDGNRPHISGPRRVDHQASGTVYSVGNAPSGSSFSWSVPTGATLVSGQGTATATVDWGTASGTVTVDVTSSCGAEPLAIDVKVDPLYVADFTFENFDDPANVTLNTATGTLTEVLNPDSGGINPSAMSGEYTRNAAEQFDVLFYDVAVINDGSDYVSEQKRFFMDVYTDAPAGSQILIQLEDSSLATPSNYPTGRHSRYQAFTSVQNQWERLDFLILDQPDPATPDGGIDDMVILFAPDTFTADTYTFDNLDSYIEDGGGDPPTPPTTMHVAAIVEGSQGAGQGAKFGTATVTLVDNLGNPVSAATVMGTFSGDFNETASGVTGGNGTVTLVTTGSKKGSLNFTFCVDDVSHGSLTYDPGSNGQSCS